MNDREARQAILSRFYEHYQKAGLHIIVNSGQVAQALGLESDQARRCFDYLEEKGMIRRLTLGGGYCPTVELVDEVESVREAGNG